MSSKQDGKNREYEVAATELVDLEDFRKYMAEEEEEEAQRQAAAEPEAAAISPAADASATEYIKPQASAPREDVKDNSKLAAILGIVSLVPFLGLVLGPVAIAMASKQKQAIDAGNATAGGLQQANIGLYLGVVGTVISVLMVVRTLF